jgi:hypothetical protein
MKKKVRDLYDQKVSVRTVDSKGQSHITEYYQPVSILKKDLTDYSYAKDIDEKVLKMAMSLAEKFAIAIIRDGINLQIDRVIEQLSSKLSEELIKKMPAQQVIIKETISSSAAEAKKETENYDFNVNLPNRNHAEGMKLKGEAAKIRKTNQTIDDTLDILDQLDG